MGKYKKKFSKNDLEWALFQDYWNLIMEFDKAENTDEYWSSVQKAINEFKIKYENSHLEGFAVKLALAFLNEKDEELKLKTV